MIKLAQGDASSEAPSVAVEGCRGSIQKDCTGENAVTSYSGDQRGAARGSGMSGGLEANAKILQQGEIAPKLLQTVAGEHFDGGDGEHATDLAQCTATLIKTVLSYTSRRRWEGER